MLRKLVVALALSLSHADNLRATRSRGRTLQEVNLVPEDEAADLKKQEEAQREKAMAEAEAQQIWWNNVLRDLEAGRPVKPPITSPYPKYELFKGGS